MRHPTLVALATALVACLAFAGCDIQPQPIPPGSGDQTGGTNPIAGGAGTAVPVDAPNDGGKTNAPTQDASFGPDADADADSDAS